MTALPAWTRLPLRSRWSRPTTAVAWRLGGFALVAACWWWSAELPTWHRHDRLIAITGWLAIATILLALLVGPAWRLATGRVPTAGRWWRRHLGMSGAEWALVHTLLGWVIEHRATFAALRLLPALRLGSLALLILLLLWLTSWPNLVRRLGLGPVWQRLHSAALVVPVLVLGHVLLHPDSWWPGWQVLLSASAALFVIRIVARWSPLGRPSIAGERWWSLRPDRKRSNRPPVPLDHRG